MKKVLSFLLAAVFCVGSVFMAYAQTTSAELIKSVEQIPKVPDGFTAISSAEELSAINNNLNGKYFLMNDIDLSNYSDWESIGTGKKPFTGMFYGNCHKIINLKQESNYDESKSFLGLFGVVENAIISDLILKNVEIKINDPFPSTYYAGSVAAFCISSKIINCSVEGSINALTGGDTYIGGLVGAVPGERYSIENDTLITDCKNSVALTVAERNDSGFDLGKADFTFVGGVVGELGGISPLVQCINEGIISAETINSARIGGVVGFSNGTIISDCANFGRMSVVPIDGSCFAGGVCGYAYSIECCLNTEAFNLENESLFYGGIAGYVSDSQTISNCYYMKDSNNAVGLVNDSVSVSAKPLLVSEMNSKESYLGFDFENIWNMGENGYPNIKSDIVWISDNKKINVGQSFKVCNNPIYIYSNDSNIVVANPDGEILGVSSGNATIELISEEGQFATINVNVRESIIFKLIHFLKKIYMMIIGLFN